ncbi:peroxidase-like [Macrobrachium nipponense]|uniref:peroxidase-like n=1 Tax=Macrobrachium nipponense TaxID=159736 RepID=UPI0030C8A0F9
MASSGYSEIPGVYSESPRPMVNVRRTIRSYRYCLAASCLVVIVVLLSALVSVLIGQSIEKAAQELTSPANQSLVTLLSLTWPRRDDSWYCQRWRHAMLRLADDPSQKVYPDLPQDPADPHNPNSTLWTRPDNSTFPKNDTWNWNRQASQGLNWTSSDISDSLATGSKKQKEITKIEDNIAKKNLSLVRGSPSYKHQVGFRKTDPLATKMAKQGYLMDHASADMKNRTNMTREHATFDMQWAGDLSESPYCDKTLLRPRPGPCDPHARYRSVDGSCNNVDHPLWGASFTSFRRAMPPDYGDGVSSLRIAYDGGQLPSAREISSKIHVNKPAESQSYTILLMAWGQFIDHDITATALAKGNNGSSFPCCTLEVSNNTPSLLHPECAPIRIPDDDPDYSPFNQTCMEFTRSASAPRCIFGPREQLNQQTAYIDGSVIYGTKDEELMTLRTHVEGLLSTQVTLDGRELLPPSLDPDDGCNTEDNYKYDQYCFRSGDARVNEQILLTAFHTIWARQHNLLATTLRDLNPDWDDEMLFQETRRIVIAQMQHITYHEYVPSILGPKFMKSMKLSPLVGDQQTDDYEETMNPSIANEFAAAAFRFGHSQVQGLVQTVDGSGKNVAFSQLKKYFFNPFILYNPGEMANLVRGEVSQSAAAVDTFFSSQVSLHLFQGSEKIGLDLVSLNIQRGRDHGLPSYNRWRMYCGLKPASNFSDLVEDMDVGALATIMKTYRHIEDVDFYTGGLAERPIEDGLVGPTFACVLADQFLRLKRGDRYWYETSDEPQAFTKDQLVQIRRISLSRILCDNVPELGSIQRWPFRTFSTGNPRLPCSSQSIPRMDYGAWEEGDLFSRAYLLSPDVRPRLSDKEPSDVPLYKG